MTWASWLQLAFWSAFLLVAAWMIWREFRSSNKQDIWVRYDRDFWDGDDRIRPARR